MSTECTPSAPHPAPLHDYDDDDNYDDDDDDDDNDDDSVLFLDVPACLPCYCRQLQVVNNQKRIAHKQNAPAETLAQVRLSGWLDVPADWSLTR